MIINGHLLCEILGKPHKGALFQSGSLLLAISAVGSFVWTDQNNWVSDPSYFVSLIIIPFIFFAVLIILNNRDIMGRERPYGWSAILLNSGNLLTFAILGSCSIYIAWNQNWGSFPVGMILTVLISTILFGGYYSLKLKKLTNRISGLESQLKSNLKN